MLREALRSEEVVSPEHLSKIRAEAFSAASDVVEDAEVSEAQALGLIKEHAAAVDSFLRERWPAMFQSIRGSLTFEDRPPRS
jgi:hypothetical protein